MDREVPFLTSRYSLQCVLLVDCVFAVRRERTLRAALLPALRKDANIAKQTDERKRETENGERAAV